MCEFISYKELDGHVFFLTNDDLKPKKLKEYKEFNVNWQEDLCGHGAIDWFYPDIKGKGSQKERTDFSSSNNFPFEIVKAIKSMQMTKIGFNLDLLNKYGKAEYEKIQQQAWAEYGKIKQPAWAEYEKIEQPAWAEYEKIEQPAWAEYGKIQQQAWAEYEKIQQPAFWNIFKQKKYRNPAWI